MSHLIDRMPKKVKSSRKHKRRNRRRKTMGDLMIYRGIGLPDSFMTKVKYSQQFALTAAALFPYQQQQFRGNSLFDPDFTGAGGQPTYYDDLCSATGPYTQYMVYASKIRVRFSAVGDTFAIGNADIALTPSISAFSATGWSDIDDQMDIQETKSTTVTRMDGAGVKTIKHYAKTRDVYTTGGASLGATQSVWAGNFNGTPSGVWYWIIGAQGMDRTSTTMNVNGLAKITYYVKFITKYQPAQS